MSVQGEASRVLTDHFRCLQEVVDLVVAEDLSPESGYFRFGPGTICYGQCSSGAPALAVKGPLHDALPEASTSGSSVHLPFDPIQVLNNLRYERYITMEVPRRTEQLLNNLVRRTYYLVRPLMPVAVRKHLQRHYLRGWDKIPFPGWPLDVTVENIFEQLLVLSMRSKNLTRIPFIWFWPEGAPTCTLVTHDVEHKAGWEYCTQLMDLDDSFGIKSAFQIVPEMRYTVSQSSVDSMRARGFETNVHDLNHDGYLLTNREEFLRRANDINRYGKKFGARGFRSALLHRNIDWLSALDFSYDMSVPNAAHLEPQRGGCCTVFPFFNGKMLELPVTMAQDYSLFHILNDYSIGVWKEQISLIQEKHGIMQMIVHPDYVIENRAREVYTELLSYLSELRDRGETWIALPGEAAAWWRLRSELELVNDAGSWTIQGEGRERARIAYATIIDGRIAYEFDPACNLNNAKGHLETPENPDLEQ